MRHFVNHRQERINDVAGSREKGKYPDNERRNDGHIARIATNYFFRKTHHEIDTTGRIHHRCRHDDGHDDE